MVLGKLPKDFLLAFFFSERERERERERESKRERERERVGVARVRRKTFSRHFSAFFPRSFVFFVSIL